MRYAFVSDIHANRQAWEATLLDLRSLRVDRIICLGDIVGYGPAPAAVLESVHAHVHHFVLGNHDAVVCDKLDDDLFNDTAQEIIRWTRGQLNRRALRFFQTLPLTLRGENFRCAHGDLGAPAAFNYLYEAHDALPSWAAVGEPLLFVGHTHEPGIFLTGRSGTPHVIAPQDFELEPEKRYLVNVGSIGQPRDTDARASYCIYDSRARSIVFRRIPFDLDAYRRDLAAAGIPVAGSSFLQHDPRQGVLPLRETASFSPAVSPAQQARNVRAVDEVVALRRRAGHWRLICLLFALCVAIGAAGAWQSGRQHVTPRSLDVNDPAILPVVAAELPPEQNLLAPLTAAPPSGPIPGWKLHLGNAQSQRIAVCSVSEGAPVLELVSSDLAELRVGGPSIRVQPGMKLAGVLRLCADEMEGAVNLELIVHRRRDGREVAEVHVANPGQKRKDGWVARKTLTMPPGATNLEYQVHGRFRGRVLLKELSLERKTGPVRAE
jgi:predicted phosphodiesterase